MYENWRTADHCRIGHVVFSSRIVYVCPVYMTVTPSERHSGLCIRLMRYQENDPGLIYNATAFCHPWVGHEVTSLCPPNDVVQVDLPEYEIRRALSVKYLVYLLYAFLDYHTRRTVEKAYSPKI